MEKSKKNMDGILIVILIAAICGGIFYVYSSNKEIKRQNEEINKLKAQTQENETTNNSNEQNVSNKNENIVQNISNKKTRDMTTEEVKDEEDLLNTLFNGYVLSTNLYSNPKEINFSEVFYNKNSAEEYLTEEVKAYEKVAGSVNTDLRKVKAEDIKVAYKNNTEEELTDSKLMEKFSDWVYLKEYDAFYIQAGDTNHQQITILKGTVDESEVTLNEEGDYIGTVYYTAELDNGNTVKYKQLYEGYGVDVFFISNEKTK